MTRILSTRILTPSQKMLVDPLRFELTEYEAISVSYKTFALQGSFDNYIITSQNAAQSLLVHIERSDKPEDLLKKNAFCVGKKTAGLLQRMGLQVEHYENNAETLGRYLVKNHANRSFLFLCGDKRREELPAILKAKKIAYREVQVYETTLNPVGFEDLYDAYLFFSPSAVRSYVMKNPGSPGTAYCIGPTTAEAARKAGLNVRVAATPAVEAVLQLLAENP